MTTHRATRRHFYDVALRDFGLLVGALAIARLAPAISFRGRWARTS